MHAQTKQIERKVKLFQDKILGLYEGKLENLTLFYDKFLNAISIDIIYLSGNNRKTGLGSEILQKCVNFAHGLGLDLVLIADDRLGTPLYTLNAFYEKNGGVQTLNSELFKWKVK